MKNRVDILGSFEFILWEMYEELVNECDFDPSIKPATQARIIEDIAERLVSKLEELAEV